MAIYALAYIAMVDLPAVARSPKEIGGAIRRRRRDLGLRQVELAKRSKLRQATISALETGEAGTQLRTLFEALSSLDMEVIVGPSASSGRHQSSAGPDACKLHAIALKTLRAWAGGEALEAVMRECAHVSVYLAGGALRDLLRSENSRPKDFDLFLGGTGVDRFIRHLARRGNLTFGSFGSPRWHPLDSPDRYADLVPISRFNNGLWKCKDIVDALNQFDFTANAIALDLRLPRLFDPQHGIRDLKSRIIRAVRFDYPEEPIAHDVALSRLSVLWFRLIHYAAVLGFAIDPVTLRWLNDNARFARDANLFAATFFNPHVASVRS
jgi:transcriptional regulator with XRE-family HTH domain